MNTARRHVALFCQGSGWWVSLAFGLTAALVFVFSDPHAALLFAVLSGLFGVIALLEYLGALWSLTYVRARKKGKRFVPDRWGQFTMEGDGPYSLGERFNWMAMAVFGAALVVELFILSNR